MTFVLLINYTCFFLPRVRDGDGQIKGTSNCRPGCVERKAIVDQYTVQPDEDGGTLIELRSFKIEYP